MILSRITLPLLLAVLLLAVAPPSRASQDMVAVSLLPGWQAEDGSRMAALRLELEPGWKTYWRAPGDAGIPPSIDWGGSRNLESAEIIWPAPEQTLTNGLRTIGYGGDVVLPVRLAPARDGAPMSLAVELSIGVCRDVCVPVETRARLDIPAGAGTRDPRIAAALAMRPYTAAEAGVGRVTCRVAPVEGGMALMAESEVPRRGARELVVVETGNPELWVAQADTKRDGNTLRARAEVYHMEGGGVVLDRGALRFTVLSSGEAVDIHGCTGG